MFEIRNMLRITNGLLKNVDAVASSLPSPLWIQGEELLDIVY
jgi:hypothetical protein